MPTVKDIYDFLDARAPFATQCDWDNSGLLLGDANRQVHRVGFALDLTAQTLQQAVDEALDLLVTHHPVIFRPKRRLLSGELVYELVRNDIAVISSHIPWDCADGGVNDVLCIALNLSNVKKIETPDTAAPLLRIGTLEHEMTPQEFAALCAKKFGTTMRLASCGKTVKTIGVVGGAAMEYCETARLHGADLFFTGDAKHHEMLDAVDSGISVLAGGHFETEHLSVYRLKCEVERAFETVSCRVLDEKNPVEFFSGNG